MQYKLKILCSIFLFLEFLIDKKEYFTETLFKFIENNLIQITADLVLNQNYLS